ncbi:YdcF family protein [Actinopolymorpha sp. B9G3]|uniref:YdcF family protein n=1 Tax=Actinopolymorpha sp. B9G3 TaxID=3158970 RepID=UPI0032D8DFA4
MSKRRRPMTDEDGKDAALIWDFHQMRHQLRPCSVGICLGGPDPGIASFAAELFRRRLYPLLLFTGANSPDTRAWFPRGEALHNCERAIELGVPADAVLVEPAATNTGENITLSRQLLADAGIETANVMLISMAYMERRAFATCRKMWPDVDVICASEPLEFDAYAERIGDPPLALDMIVGDLQRVIEYPKKGFAIPQHVPDHVLNAYDRLVAAGYTTRLAAV